MGHHPAQLYFFANDALLAVQVFALYGEDDLAAALCEALGVTCSVYGGGLLGAPDERFCLAVTALRAMAAEYRVSKRTVDCDHKYGFLCELDQSQPCR